MIWPLGSRNHAPDDNPTKGHLMTFRSPTMLSWLASLLATLALISPAIAEDKDMKRTITVSATGLAEAVPDRARIQTGVTAEAATAREALAKNTGVMTKLIAGLKDSGVEGKDIQTSNFNIEPRYTYPKDNQPPVIDGYRVVNQVEVTARDLDKLGDILDRLVSLGANQMHGLSFEVSAAETLRDAARKAAIANARRRAELYAEAAGAKVGKVIAISEDTAGVVQPFVGGARAAMAEAVPIERGTETLEARVTVTWALD